MFPGSRVDAHRRTDLYVRVELGGRGLGHSDAAVRSRIAGQNPDVHADAFAGQAHEPFHRGADIVGAARRGIDPRADPAAHRAPLGINVVAVEAGAVIFVLL